MTQAGMMINLHKCSFLVPRAKILGLDVTQDSYRLHEKSLKSWLQACIPTNLRELESLLGQLLWASTFIPDYKKLVGPIEALLGRRGKAVWTEQCTQVLNQLLEVIFRRYELAIPQLGAPITLYLSTDKEVGVAVFT